MGLVAINLENAKVLIWIGMQLGIGLTFGYIVVTVMATIINYFIAPKKQEVDMEKVFADALKRKDEQEKED